MERPAASPFRDITRETAEKLRQLTLRDEKFAVEPQNLYLRSPGTPYRWTEYIDKGCRGGWTEDRTSHLGGEPVKVTRIYGARSMTVEVSLPHGGTGMLAGLGEATYFENTESQPKNLDAQVAATLEEYLVRNPFVRLTDFDEVIGIDADVRVTPKDPLVKPLSMRHRGKKQPLDIIVSTLEAFRDSDGTYVNLPDEHIEDQWYRLEEVQFTAVERNEHQHLQHLLFHAATRLIADYPRGDESHELSYLNSLLATHDIDYTIYRGRTHYDSPAGFVIASVGSGDQLTNPRQPERLMDTISPYIHASRVIHTDPAPWVVDDELHIATPLRAPSLDRTKPSWGTQITSVD